MKKEERTTKEKRQRLNFIDFLLIGIILVSVGMLIFVLASGRGSVVKKNNTGIEYTVVIDRLPESFRNLVKVGNKVYESETLCALGEVTDVSYSVSEYKGTDKASGEVIVSEYPGTVKMTVRIKAGADKTDGGYKISEYKLSVGQKVGIRVPDYTGEGVCTSIEEAEENR